MKLNRMKIYPQDCSRLITATVLQDLPWQQEGCWDTVLFEKQDRLTAGSLVSGNALKSRLQITSLSCRVKHSKGLGFLETSKHIASRIKQKSKQLDFISDSVS